MNKFIIASCVELDENENENGYSGPAVVLGCVDDPALVLYFPLSSEKAEMLNYLIKEGDYSINTDILGLYKTMLDSWSSGNRFLSGIILNCAYDEELDDEIMSVELVLSNSSTGLIESVVPVSFINSMILAAMQNLEVIVTMRLINKLLPEEGFEGDDEGMDDMDNMDDMDDMVEETKISKFPEDGEILDIVKGIMDGQSAKDATSDIPQDPPEEKKSRKRPTSKKTSSRKTSSRKKPLSKTDEDPKDSKGSKGSDK